MHKTLILCCAVFLLAASAAAQPEELKFVVIMTRHGVRSPVWTPQHLNQISASPWPDWGVAPGELTPHGRELMKIMGSFYRDYFSAKGLPGLSGKDCTAASRTYFHADSIERTIVTAQALAETMLPGCTVAVHHAGKDKDGKDNADPLFVVAGNGLSESNTALMVAAVNARLGSRPDAFIDAHKPAFDLLTQVLNGAGKAAHSIFDEPTSTTTGIVLNGPLGSAYTLTESLLLEYEDGMNDDRLGWGRLNPKNLLELMSLHTATADLTQRTLPMARAGGSDLLNYVLSSLEQAATGKPVAGAAGSPGNSLLVISGHNTNQIFLSGLLRLSWLLPGYQPDYTPPGGALIFTLWHSPTTGQYSVRLQFVSQTLDQMHNTTPLSLANPPAMTDVFVPGCSTAANGYPCGWAAFRTVARSAIAQEFLPK